MTRIGLLSDTHGYLDPSIIGHFSGCHEIWHAGDWGSLSLSSALAESTGLPLRGVYGNIDGQDIRSLYPENLIFTCESVPVLIRHIGGYPNKYAPGVADMISKNRIKLFISGHSHILKIMYDEKLQCLHMNPGAAGKQGWQKVRTMVTFSIDGDDIKDCNIIEM